jgi:ketosteroid isomerase-like protein
MEGFSNVAFENAVWLPGVDTTSYTNDGSVRVYGTWTGESNETGNSFSVDSYHYFDIQDGQIIASGDYFDATGMVIAVSAQTEEE